MEKREENTIEIIRTKYSKIRVPKDVKIKTQTEWEIIEELSEEQKNLVEKIISTFKINTQEGSIFIFPAEKKIIIGDKRKKKEKIIIEDKRKDKENKENKKIDFQTQINTTSSQPIENIIKEHSKSLNIKLQDGDNVFLIFADKENGFDLIPNSLKIETEKGSYVRIFKVYIDEAQIWEASSIEILVGENSKVELFSFEESGEKAKFFERMKILLEEKSEIKEGNIWRGEGRGFLIKDVILEGKESSAYDYHIISSFGSKNLEVIYNMEHKGEKTKGEVIVRALTKDKSQVVFLQNAKIINQAKWSDSYIEGKAINFSPDAKVFLVPSMQIDTNIVNAKHAASVAKVGENEIFYLTSRGIEPDLAEKIIVEGFFYELAEKMPTDIDEIIPKLLYHHRVLSL
ncbi:MAG: SufD family Fe-S cluster assembly protein [Candidatus Calescibacterium sp.]|jgi:Fe-S cluster assembly scaffold protein SufB